MYKMFKNHNIEVCRGDSFTINFPINLGSPIFPEYYTLQENDSVYFGLMEPNQDFEDALIRKMYTSNNQNDSIISMSFEPTDTEELLPGKYYYSIKLQKANGEVYTLIPKTSFVIFD